METNRDCAPDEVRKAGQSVRKAISKLRAALREAGLDQYVIIMSGGPKEMPEYRMIWKPADPRQPASRKAVQATSG
jgi:hypothetical protein